MCHIIHLTLGTTYNCILPEGTVILVVGCTVFFSPEAQTLSSNLINKSTHYLSALHLILFILSV